MFQPFRRKELSAENTNSVAWPGVCIFPMPGCGENSRTHVFTTHHMTFHGLILFSTLMNHSRFVRLFKRVCVFLRLLACFVVVLFFQDHFRDRSYKTNKNCIIFVFIDLPAAPFHG